MPMRTGGSRYSNGWFGFGIVVSLQVVTEVGPWLLGFGGKAIIDWSFWAISLRFLVVPAIAAVYLVCVLRSAVVFGHSRPIACLQGVVAVFLCAYPFIIPSGLWPWP